MMIRNVILLLLIAGFSQSAFAQNDPLQKGILLVEEEEGIKEMHQDYISEEKTLEGFRVQIYNGRKDACTAKRSQFKQVYPNVSVYTLYEAPEYRIQAGDFRTRLEAEKFLNEIEGTFSGSFVVKTEIEYPELGG